MPPSHPWTGLHSWVSNEVVASLYLAQQVQDLLYLRERTQLALVTNHDAAGAAAGALLVQDAAHDEGVLLSGTTAGAVGPYVVALDTMATGATGAVAVAGYAQVAYVGTAPTPGQRLQASATAGSCQVGAANSFATAWTTGSSGMVWAWLDGSPGQAGLTLTTLGDVLYRDAAGLQRLAGNTTSTRQFLRQTGTGTVSAAPAWDTLAAADLPAAVGCRLYATVTQSIPNTTMTALAFTTATWNPQTFWVVGTPAQCVVPTGLGGTYLLTGHVWLASSVLGNVRGAQLTVNGTVVLEPLQPYVGGGNPTAIVATTIYRLSAGDVVQLWAYQDTGGALTTLVDGIEAPSLSLARLGA